MRRLPVLLLALVLGACADTAAERPAPVAPTASVEAPVASRIQGVTLDAVDRPSESPLVELERLGVRHVALIPYGFQRGHDDPDLRFNPEPGWYSEGTTAARTLAADAAARGMAVVLKPQLWLGRDAGEHWSATIGFETEKGWQAWEANYRRLILHHARTAEEIGSPLFVVGTELGRAAREREAFWRSLIAEVRGVFSGELTYAANWHDDLEHIRFWDALDVVAVQAYFPLAESKDAVPGVEALVAAWAPHERMLREIAEREGKPVLFTEVGYRPMPFAAAEPWESGRREGVEPDPAAQARLYEAFFRALWDEPWFAGAVLWKWVVPPERPHRWHRFDWVATSYSFRGRPAEAVVARWFGKAGEERSAGGTGGPTP